MAGMTARRTTVAPLSLADLAALTQTVADDVRAGLHEVRADADDRWHVRLRCDDRVDVWLISWTEDQGTQLHDHGGSSGAFTVVSGELSETVWTPGAQVLTEAARRAGDSVVFGGRYVHDVRNVRQQTAVSVHAYSPPLALMSYYDVDGGGLTRLASAWTDDPEAPPSGLRAAS
ncbi:cysteine dioxygenase [Aeromicrobium yanjiei]|uniref:Cysteine dioxygenase n=2 Tax=Aeromicrobium yanjiei TaxID=2662028 RepID=A0A5Q2MJY7_9ACTN|nr:cysteine dioxygenase [Aeromicrobium yanjiei]